MKLSGVFKNNKESFLLLTYAAIAPLLTESFFTYYILNNIDKINAFSHTDWTLIFLVLSVTLALSLNHTTFIAIVAGYFLHWYSLFYIAISFILASALGYGIARKLDRHNIRESLTQTEAAQKIKNELLNRQSRIIFLSRLSPVLPFGLMNFVFAFLKADFVKFLTAGFAGMLPRTCLFIYLGIQSREIIEVIKHPSKSSLSQISFIGLTIFSIFGLFYVINRAIQKALKK